MSPVDKVTFLYVKHTQLYFIRYSTLYGWISKPAHSDTAMFVTLGKVKIKTTKPGGTSMYFHKYFTFSDVSPKLAVAFVTRATS